MTLRRIRAWAQDGEKFNPMTEDGCYSLRPSRKPLKERVKQLTLASIKRPDKNVRTSCE